MIQNASYASAILIFLSIIIVPHSYRMVMGIDDVDYFFEDWSWSWKNQVEASQYDDAYFDRDSQEIDINQFHLNGQNGRALNNRLSSSTSSNIEGDNNEGDFEFFLNSPKRKSVFSFRFSSVRQQSSIARENRISTLSWESSRRETGI